ncbi:STE3-like pheromone receptor [Paxillus ammoniavirescens]|nr:STE3-like pheromone receptor [Paxillus ammoniavirescens]
MVPPNSIFSALSFIGFLLASIPLPWHLQAWNTGTCMYMIWTSLGCLIMFVNSIVWNDNVVNWAPVWCDISSRYIVGASIGIPASALCINRRLYYIVKLQSLSYGKKEKRREIVVDASIGVGFPCVVMALQYVVQGHRFNIFEQIGCYPATMNTLPAYFLIFMWPLLVGLISMVYAACTFRLALRQKSRLREMLHTGCSIDAGRYWRLMALCTTEIIFTVPLSLYSIIMNAVDNAPMPYVSWAYIHEGFSAVGQYPSVAWQTSPASIASLEVSRWCFFLCAFVVFAFFGWTEECRDFYRHAFWSVGRCLRVSTISPIDRELFPR